MICVSLGRTRHSAFLFGHKRLAEQKAELVELRIDWLRKRPDIGRLLKDRPTPVLVTCRRPEDRGRWAGNEDLRRALLREAIVAGAEYVDLEVDVAGSIPRYGPTQRVVSYHNFDETPLELPDIYEKCAQCDPDVIKIVTMANAPSDNVRILDLVRRADKPVIAFCMGELGTVSRLLCGRYGSPWTYAGFSRDREMAPGQLTYAEVRHLYRFNRITEKTRVFAVIGDPIAHSMSPLIHNAAFQKLRFDGVYLPIRIPPDYLLETLQEFRDLGIEGYSVTIPHKEHVLEFVDAPDVQTDLIGASNTVFRRDGQWLATNTDYDAVLQCVLKGVRPSGEGTAADLVGKRVLILGAGGAARAAACAMQQSGATVTITNRTKERAKALAEELGCLTIMWENRGGEYADILINCTSVGMHPHVDDTPYQANWIDESCLVFDTVYNPENTLLLKQARERGCRTVSGIDMFISQAARQFELFTGLEAPEEYMRETLRRGMSAAAV